MKISVLIAIYSEPIEWMRHALNSILNQTYKNFEVVLINDNPGRIENDLLVQEYSEKFENFIYIKNEQNLGLTKSLNIGLKACKGEFIARMDADDISLRNRFEKQVKFLTENSEYVLCSVQRIDFDESKKYYSYSPISHNTIKAALVINSPMTHPGVMFRRLVIVENNLSYNEDCIFAQDYEFWTRLIFWGKFYNIPEYLLEYRNNNHGQTARNKKNISAKSALISSIQSSYLSRIGCVFTEKEIDLLFNLSLNELISEIDSDRYEGNFIVAFFDKLKTIGDREGMFYYGKIFLKTVYFKKVPLRMALFNKFLYKGIIYIFVQKIRVFNMKKFLDEA